MCCAGKLDNLQLTKVGINSKMCLNINCTCLKILPPYIAGKRSLLFTKTQDPPPPLLLQPCFGCYCKSKLIQHHRAVFKLGQHAEFRNVG